MKVDYQVLPTGANGFRVRVTRHEDGSFLAEELIVPDKEGWRVQKSQPGGWGTDSPLHATLEAAGEWFASQVAGE
jgi:hypothetical protein